MIFNRNAIENYVKKASSLSSADKAVLVAQAFGTTVVYLINGKKTQKESTLAIPSQQKELLDTISKLNKYNHEIITSLVKTFLNFQIKNKTLRERIGSTQIDTFWLIHTLQLDLIIDILKTEATKWSQELNQ